MILRPAKFGGRKVGLVVCVEGLVFEALSPRYEPAWGEASSIAIVLVDGLEVWGKTGTWRSELSEVSSRPHDVLVAD